MSGLPSHGTGFAESEAFMDVVEQLDRYQDGGLPPSFDAVRHRLQTTFNIRELRNLEVVTQTLAVLIGGELRARGEQPDYDLTHIRF